jgi:hypothetical protein
LGIRRAEYTASRVDGFGGFLEANLEEF